MTSAKQLPDTIKLTTLDRSFLVSETSDDEGPYFPMSIACAVSLKRPISAQEMISAIHKVEQKYPQFRLGYKLDYIHNRWQRVPDESLESYFAAFVQPVVTSTIEAGLSAAVETNNVPLSQPALIILNDKLLIFKIHHSFGDAKFLFHLLGTLLFAIADPAGFERLPDLSMNFSLPIVRLVFQTPIQTIRMLSRSIKVIKGYFQSYKEDTAAGGPNATLSPIVTGVKMGVVCKLISREIIQTLNDLRNTFSSEVKVSLNTLLQTLIGLRLVELGLLRPPILYSIPVDMRRYLKDQSVFYPGNISSQTRIRSQITEQPTVREESISLQREVDKRLAEWEPLEGFPTECLYALSDKAYRNANREWLLSSIRTDKRFFVLSNVGNLDTAFTRSANLLDLSKGVFFAIPLMAGPHLIISFSTLAEQGHLTITYDPRVLTEQQIQDILGVFEPGWIEEKAGR